LFTTIEPPSAGHSHVYVYRVDQFYLHGSSFEVTVDGRALANLAPGSFAALKLAPGAHWLGVDMHGFMGDADQAIYGPSGTTQFYQLDFEARGRMASRLLLGPIVSAIVDSQLNATLQPRTPEQARLDLATLKNVSTTGAMLSLEKDGAYASIADVDAVPGLGESDKIRYREWVGTSNPKAAVLADGGKLFLSNAANSARTGTLGSEAFQLQMTMKTCKGSGATGCTPYALGKRVVWNKP
jgi:hypothetical protein